MFTAIVTILSILLTIGLGIAGYSYLGPQMENGQDRAKLEQYTNQYEQIQGALELYQTDHNGALPSGTPQNEAQDLLDGDYLSVFPPGPWLLEGGTIYRVLDSNKTCRALNSASGLDMSSPEIQSYGGCPDCDDSAFSNYFACQRLTTDTSVPTAF